MKIQKQIEERIMEISRGQKTKLGLILLNFGFGAGLGALGKHTNHQEIPAIPIVMDIFFGDVGKNHLVPYLAYGAGVAMNYLPEIYKIIQDNLGG